MNKVESQQINSYAFALYSIYKEEKNDFLNDLKIIAKELESNDVFVDILSSYNISKKERKKILEGVFLKNTNKYVLNFLYVLVDNNFFKNVLKILDLFFKYYFLEENILNVVVESAFEVTNNEQKQIINYLKQYYKKEIICNFVINKNIIGGIKIIINDEDVIDYSIKGKLDQLKFDILNNGDKK